LRRADTIAVGDVPFTATTFDGAVAAFVQEAAAGRLGAFPVRLANAWCVALAAQDSGYRDLLNGPGTNLPDGTPVAWVMRAKGRAEGITADRVRGPSFFEEALDAGRVVGLRHFLLGGTPESLDVLRERIEARFPGIEIVGGWAPPFAPLSEAFHEEAARRVAMTDAQVVWVGLGTPKQDYAAAELARRLSIPAVGVGAAFDFLAGTAVEAPRFVQRSGLEWLFRLATEPRRLWRRYLIGNAQFAAAVLRAELEPVTVHV
jgi:N-acetylglucosaminyldiphosphoundecaprenol N-acetyl-beta-D-mannosaminyltransferase